MEVAQATLDDVQALQAFFWEAWKIAGPSGLGWTGATEGVLKEITAKEALEATIIQPHSRLFVARKEGKIVGFCATRRFDDKTVELAGIMVLEMMLGRGIGGRLFEEARSAALRDGFRYMFVKTEANNERAILFYKKKGFVVVREKDEDIQGKEVRLVELTLTLPDKD